MNLRGKNWTINGKERLNYSLEMSWIFLFFGIVNCIFRERDVREIKFLRNGLNFCLSYFGFGWIIDSCFLWNEI